MAAVTRRQYKGAATQTTITTALAAGGTSITLASTTGFPSAAGVPFFVVISPGTSSEEKCLATISGSVLTLTRAQDDTTAQSHSSGATIFPVFTADDADEANKLASTLTTRGDLLTMDSGPDFKRLALGAANTVLKSDGSDALWGTVAAANIASSAVETAKINDAAVTGAKLANFTVNTSTDDYTLVVGDRNTRRVANKSTSITFTVPNSVFAAGDIVQVHNIGAGTLTISAGAGMTLNGADVLTLAQYQGGELFFTSASSAIFFPTAKTVSAGGLVFITAGTFTNSATVSMAAGTFTNTFKNYVVTFNITACSTNQTIGIRVNNAGTPRTAAEYFGSKADVSFAGGQTLTGTNAGTSLNAMAESTYITLGATIYVYAPTATATNTSFTGNAFGVNQGLTASSNTTFGGTYNALEAHDGLTFVVGGTISGNFRVYGLADS
ncbi:MAG: hypothetical protein FJ211_10455 [Ignavibacteria bacterium]|nr:hypothetical protein [Ignavibacteria bacterium]